MTILHGPWKQRRIFQFKWSMNRLNRLNRFKRLLPNMLVPKYVYKHRFCDDLSLLFFILSRHCQSPCKITHKNKIYIQFRHMQNDCNCSLFNKTAFCFRVIKFFAFFLNWYVSFFDHILQLYWTTSFDRRRKKNCSLSCILSICIVFQLLIGFTNPFTRRQNSKWN